MRRLGSSDAPKLAGVSKYGNARDVFEDIVHGIKGPKRAVMERGTAVEPVGARLYLEAGHSKAEFTFDKSVGHPRYEFAAARADGVGELPEGRVLVEIKSVNNWAAKKWGEEGTDHIPQDYLCQVAWAMACCDCDMAHVFAMFGRDVPGEGGAEFFLDETKLFVVWRDSELENMLFDVGRHFWEQHVLTGIPPSIEPLENKRAIREFYKQGGVYVASRSGGVGIKVAAQ